MYLVVKTQDTLIKNITLRANFNHFLVNVERVDLRSSFVMTAVVAAAAATASALAPSANETLRIGLMGLEYADRMRGSVFHLRDGKIVYYNDNSVAAAKEVTSEVGDDRTLSLTIDDSWRIVMTTAIHARAEELARNQPIECVEQDITSHHNATRETIEFLCHAVDPNVPLPCDYVTLIAGAVVMIASRADTMTFDNKRTRKIQAATTYRRLRDPSNHDPKDLVGYLVWDMLK